MKGIERLIEFVLEVRWNDLPAEVRDLAEMIKTDDFGSLYAGVNVKSSRIAADYAKEAWGNGDCTIFATGDKSRPEGAAFANGVAINALDVDDCGLYTKGHPGCQIFPTLLALGEDLGISGRGFCESLAVGYELAARVARPWHDYYGTYRAGGSWGSVAAAGVAARLMDLTPGETLEAFRIAEYNSPYIPIDRGVSDPSMVKHGAGYGPVAGITAARLAKKGFTGTETILSLDRYGNWLDDVGSDFVIQGGVVWKEYASCAWTHPALDAVKTLVEDTGMSSEEIESVHVRGHGPAIQLGTEVPTTTEEAQFNLAWPVAAFLVDGEVGPEQVEGDALQNGTIIDMAQKIEIEEDPEFTAQYERAVRGEPGGKHAAEVDIKTASGEVFSSGPVEGNIKYPPDGWDLERIENKFRRVVSHAQPKGRVEELLDWTTNLSEIDNLRGYSEELELG